MKRCVRCNKTLKSQKETTKVCSTCTFKRLDPINKECLFCKQAYLDKSRSKNQKYCSLRCNTNAGHARYNDKVAAGIIPKQIDKRDRREHRKYRYHNDINFKISLVLRSRLSRAIRGNAKRGSAVKDLGCPIDELKVYLESKFSEGMTWDNWSKDGWHIDHIIPISSFNLSDAEDVKKACHYTNLQPLWAKDNHKKSDRMNESSNTQKPIYILAGPNGCGKTTLANSLQDKFNIIDYDKHSFNNCLKLALEENDKPHLIVTPIQAKRLKRLIEESGFSTVCVYLRENKDIIIERITSRGGKITDTIDKRIARYESLKDKVFDFYGPYNEAYQFLHKA